MKAYLGITGSIFGLMALLHVWRALAERDMMTRAPVEFWCRVAIGALAAALSIWAWRLFARVR